MISAFSFSSALTLVDSVAIRVAVKTIAMKRCISGVPGTWWREELVDPIEASLSFVNHLKQALWLVFSSVTSGSPRFSSLILLADHTSRDKSETVGCTVLQQLGLRGFRPRL